jgi:L-fucose mutarotase/ribose pyranase (RbsD/FucU family)
MQVDDEPETLPNIQREAQAEVDRAAGKAETFATIVRKDFYERAKKAYCVILMVKCADEAASVAPPKTCSPCASTCLKAVINPLSSS